MYKNILFPIDIAQESSWRKALPVVIEQTRQNAAKLHILAVAPGAPPQLAFLPTDYSQRAVAHATEKLAEVVKQNIPEDIPAQQHVRQGSVYREILQLARELNADLIIMASHQPEFDDFLLGPNASRVVRHSHCSVLVVRN